MMREAIQNFPSQLTFNPRIENARRLNRHYEYYIVVGMGGSHLAADEIKALEPTLPLIIHSDYGLPPLNSRAKAKTLVIVSSYSGTTEETIHSYHEARRYGYDTVVIATGGVLLGEAKTRRLPYVQLPLTGIQPRSALGFNFIALARVLKKSRLIQEACKLSRRLHPNTLAINGKRLAKLLTGKVPIVYSSSRNASLAYNWKIKFNETAKIPAFFNIIPELNHNEMTGFDIVRNTRSLSQKFHFLLLGDADDSPNIRKRMRVLKELYGSRGLPVTVSHLRGRTRMEKIFVSILTADWTALALAETYGVEADDVPLVQEFKKRIA